MWGANSFVRSQRTDLLEEVLRALFVNEYFLRTSLFGLLCNILQKSKPSLVYSCHHQKGLVCRVF